MEKSGFADVIRKAMGDRGYFTVDDFVYYLLMRPNEHWTYRKAEQTLYA